MSLCFKHTIGKSKTVITCVYKNPKVFLTCMLRITDPILITYEYFTFFGYMNCCPSKPDTLQIFVFYTILVI